MAHDDREMILPKWAANGNTIDPESGNEIRATDNGLREGDIESPQDARPLTQDEIAKLIAKAGDRDGNR